MPHIVVWGSGKVVNHVKQRIGNFMVAPAALLAACVVFNLLRASVLPAAPVPAICPKRSPPEMAPEHKQAKIESEAFSFPFDIYNSTRLAFELNSL